MGSGTGVFFETSSPQLKERTKTTKRNLRISTPLPSSVQFTYNTRAKNNHPHSEPTYLGKKSREA
jgi:hypothetical protein